MKILRGVNAIRGLLFCSLFGAANITTNAANADQCSNASSMSARWSTVIKEAGNTLINTIFWLIDTSYQYRSFISIAKEVKGSPNKVTPYQGTADHFKICALQLLKETACFIGLVPNNYRNC